MASPRTVTNLQTYIAKISAEAPPPGKVVVYRGHPDAAFRLQPSVFRSAAATEREHLLLRDLIAAHPHEFAADGSTLEQLVRMQHYSLPTRLLDVTWNPMVALYFAAEEHQKSVKLATRTKKGSFRERTVSTSGEVVRLTIDEDLVKYFDSDTVSCLTNIARCRMEQKEEIRGLVGHRARFSDAEREAFNKIETVRRLLHFIRTEKPAFEPEIVPPHLMGMFLVKPKQNNRRILAQEGAFIAFGLTDELPQAGVPGIKIDRIPIKVRYKPAILSQLKLMSINQRTLFPEIERAARYFTDELSTSDLLSRGAGPVSGSLGARPSSAKP